MDLSIRLLLLYAAVAVHSKESDVRLPPSIIRQNETLTTYLGIDAKLLLVCDADGHPEPEYEWYKDGAVWNPKPGDVQSTPGSGNRTIPSFSYTHAGMFQCFAFNKYGKTMTQKITIEVAVIAKFQPKDTDSITKDEGDNMKLLCNAPKSMPSPTLSWKPVESLSQNAAQMNIELTQRVQMDDEGNLVFAHVMTDDHIDNWLYRCVAENAIAGLSAFGSYAQLIINPDPGRTIKPAIQSYTGNQGDTVVALKHGTISLRCLFSGKPEPQVTWKRVDNKPLMGDRTDYEQFQTVLTINDVQDYDEAVYRCTGANSEGSSSHDIALTVEAVPEFVDGKQPKNQNATDGDEVVFPCDAVAEPKGDIVWYKNSEELTASNIPARVSIDGDRKNLRISDVCRDCSSGGTDLSVYGCEVVNEHGSNLSSGYLNVLFLSSSATSSMVFGLAPLLTAWASELFFL